MGIIPTTLVHSTLSPPNFTLSRFRASIARIPVPFKGKIQLSTNGHLRTTPLSVQTFLARSCPRMGQLLPLIIHTTTPTTCRLPNLTLQTTLAPTTNIHILLVEYPLEWALSHLAHARPWLIFNPANIRNTSNRQERVNAPLVLR